jgi:hypothetical protein
MKLLTSSSLLLMQRFLLLSGAAILPAFSASAQSPAPKPETSPETSVDWPNLCASTAKELLVVTTESGDTIQGYCVFVQHDELTVRTVDGKMVKIARGTLQKVLALSVPEHRLKALGKGMKQGLHDGVTMTFSPLAPLGLAVIPGTLAWGAVAAPFCIVGDLFAGKPTQRVLAIRQ